MATPIYLEAGTRRVFACSLEWPGWARSGKTEEAAMEALAGYAGRYAIVAAEAGVRFPASAGRTLEVVERLPGTSTTDFGAPGVVPAADHQSLTKVRAERLASLVEASWTVFDRVVAGAPAALRKGPRGGGRDRDAIVAHLLGSEPGYFRQVGIRASKPPAGGADTAGELRAALLDALRAARAPRSDHSEKAWPWRYAARRVAWHTLDHAWEIEDKSS